MTDRQMSLGVLTPRHSIREIVTSDGFAILPGYRPGVPGIDITFSLGTPYVAAPALHALKPAAKEAAPLNTYTGNFGFDQFPFHTDLAHWQMPPRYVLLRCVVGFDEVPTKLVDGKHIVKAVGPEVLGRALVQPRRPMEGKLPLLRLFEAFNGQHLLRWDEVFIRPASNAGKLGMTLLREALSHVPQLSVILRNRGDTLIIDNWRFLHARAAIPPKCTTRLIERAYLETLH